MFPSTSLLSCVVLALALQSTAAPLTLPQDFSNFTAIVPLYRSSALNATLPAGSLQNILASDQTRARALLINARPPVDAILAQAAPVSFSIVNALTVYTARVTSSSNTTYDLVVDTGSSNLWVGAGKPFHSSSTSKSTGKTFHVSYGSGEVEGMEWIEHISLAPQLAADGQSIGVATKSHGLEGYDGIIGIGPVGLTHNTVAGRTTVPTITDTLYAQHVIPSAAVGVFFSPSFPHGSKLHSNSSSGSDGELTFGGPNPARVVGALTYAPLTKSNPARAYWGVDASLSYVGGHDVLAGGAGILDTGTTLLLLASDAFAKYKTSTGAEMDSHTGLLALPKANYHKLKDLVFTIGGRDFKLSPDGQIWPTYLNKALGGSDDKVYLVAGDLGSPSGQGLDFIAGFSFLQRFYTVYDTTQSRIGLGETEWTHKQVNFQA